MASLEPGTTTLLFRTARPVTSEEFLQHMQGICGFSEQVFDFVYSPWPRLVIVNFLSHDLCRETMDAMLLDKGCISKVQAAVYQGLIANLATFCAKGKKGAEGTKLPRIFLEGNEVSFDVAVSTLLTEEEIQQHKDALKLESRLKAERKRGKVAESSIQPETGDVLQALPSVPPFLRTIPGSSSSSSANWTFPQPPPDVGADAGNTASEDQGSGGISVALKDGQWVFEL